MLEKNKLTIAEEYLETAFQLQMNGKIDEAIENYKLSIEFFPTAQAYTFLGWALSKKGKIEDAIINCKIAIEIDPDFGNPYNDIGSYLVSLGRDDEAIDWFNKAIDAKNYVPRHFPYYNLGKIFEKRGKWFEAISFYKKAIELEPNYKPASDAVSQLTALMN